jgi:hypothetical protein
LRMFLPQRNTKFCGNGKVKCPNLLIRQCKHASKQHTVHHQYIQKLCVH